MRFFVFAVVFSTICLVSNSHACQRKQTDPPIQVWICSGDCPKKNETCTTSVDILMNVTCECKRKKSTSTAISDEETALDPVLSEMEDLFGPGSL